MTYVPTTQDELCQWLFDHRGNGFKMPDGSIVPLTVMSQYHHWLQQTPDAQFERFIETLSRIGDRDDWIFNSPTE